MDQLLKILSDNALPPAADIARMLGISAEEVRQKIDDYEKRKVILGYKAVIDEDKLNLDRVKAVIEVKVQPEREGGFDRLASRIGKFPEVRSMFLASGTFDFLLFVEGANLREVASFVSETVSTIEGVTATATHFMLKTYKFEGVLMKGQDSNERLSIAP